MTAATAEGRTADGHHTPKRWNDPVSPTDGTRIFVARYRPRYLRKSDEIWTEWRKELAPSRDLHAAWYGKSGQPKTSFSQFVERYRQEMQGQLEAITELAQRVAGGENLTLLCYCENENECHRALLKEMIEAKVKRMLEQD